MRNAMSVKNKTHKRRHVITIRKSANNIYVSLICTVSSCVRRCNKAPKYHFMAELGRSDHLSLFFTVDGLESDRRKPNGPYTVADLLKCRKFFVGAFPTRYSVTVGKLGTAICMMTIQWRGSSQRKLNPLNNALSSITPRHNGRCCPLGDNN